MQIKLCDREIELSEQEAEELREIGRHSRSEERHCLHAVMLDDYGHSLVALRLVECVGVRADRLRVTLDGCDAIYELMRAEVRRASERPASAVAVEAAL